MRYVLHPGYITSKCDNDMFRPRSEPALTIYEAFQAEARHRKMRGWEQWNRAEIEAVWRAARDYAQMHDLRVPTLAEVEAGERYASGSIDYGAKWACQVAAKMVATPNGQGNGPREA